MIMNFTNKTRCYLAKATGVCILFVLLFAQNTKGQTSVTSGITQAGYSLNTSAIAVDPGLTITSGAAINGFKVTISAGLKSSDVLSYTGTLPSGVTVTAYNSSTGVITFNGSASAANWQTFLRTITYQNTNTSEYGDRTITFSAGSLSANSNGHFYEYVSTAGSWTTAKSSAAARTYLGYTGYLATITSASENAYIRQVLNADAWIGSSDERTQINTATGTSTYANQSAAEGNWYWVTGPEAGTMFSVGNNSPVTQSGQYANWNSGEPNNVGSEHYGEIYSSGSNPGAWNDLPNGVSLGYIVEYGGLGTDPVQNISTNTTIYTNISSNTATGAQVICNGASASAITGATPYGGYGSYTYKWISSTTSATDGFSDASGTINTASYTPGTLTNTTWFRRVVTSGSLSDTSAAVMKTVNPALSSSASQTNVACNGATTGIASISVSGGTSGYTYSWSPSGGTAASASGLTAGVYTCLVTDANGCTLSRNYTITQPTALSASTSSTNVNCNGASNGTAAILMSGGTPSYTYSWSPSGGTSATATGLTAGAYTCVATDANGCTIASNYTITQPSALSISNSSTNVSCNAGINGAASVSVSGGTAGYTYNWAPGNPTGDGTASVTGLSAGTWTCTVTDANGCTSTQTITISQPTALVAAVLSQTNISCNGGSNGAATVSVSGGTSAYSYNWTPGNPTGDGSASVSGLTTGTWTCLVTDANGCTTSQNYSITQPTALAASTASTNVSCNGAANGTAVVTLSGGTPSYTYSWSPSGGNNATATSLDAGSYTCVATDANGCTIARNYTITQPTALSISNSSTNVNCNGGTNGAASVTPTGGTSPYTYAWSNGGTTSSKTGLSAGTYTCTTTDANGCTSVTTFTITQPTTIAATATSTNVSCNGGSNGQAVISVSGGTSSYSYAWSPSGGTSATATGLSAGAYTCVVTDANGCTLSQNYTITQPTVLAASSSATNVDCYGNANGTATVTPSGGTSGYTYSWFPTGQTTATASSLQDGTYICTITDANGCTTTSSVQITEPGGSLSINVGGSNVDCNGQASGLAATGVSGGTFPYAYAWSNGNTNGAMNSLVAGVYTCIVTDANGCTTQGSITITEPPAISLSTSTVDPLCFGLTGSASVSATGGTGNISFSWTNGGSGAAVNNLAAGTYTVTAMDDNFCMVDQIVTITEPAQISSTTSITNPLCNGGTGSATISVTGGTGTYTYVWSSGGTTDVEQNLNAGQYTVAVTDANGCTYTENVTVTEPTAISTTFSTVDPLCNGGTGNAAIGVTGGTGNFTYAWSTGGTTDTELNLSAGTYQVQVTDQNGCIENASVTINEPTAITASGTATDENCNQLNGTLSITTGGGTGNLSYLWDNGNTTNALTGLSTGSYMVTVTDDNGCAESFTFTVGATAVPVATATTNDVTCNGDSNGAIDLQVSSGTGNYTYNWSNGMTTEDLQTIPGGNYVCTVTDAAGCFTIATVTVNEPAAINGTYTTTNEITGNDGSIDLTVSGGTAGYTFMWDNGATTEDISGLPADDYTVIITDANGCTTSYTITVSSSVGLDPNANAVVVQVYPNPNNGVFFIKGLPTGQYRVVDAIGRSITQFVAQNSDNTILDLSHISNGLYFIHTADGSMNSIAKFSIMK